MGQKHLLGLRQNRKRAVKPELNQEKTEDSESPKDWMELAVCYRQQADNQSLARTATLPWKVAETHKQELQWLLGLTLALS